MLLSKKNKNKRRSSSNKFSLTKTPRIYLYWRASWRTGRCHQHRTRIFSPTRTMESMTTCEASHVQVQPKAASKCCLAGSSNLTINIQHIWWHWSLHPSELLSNIISSGQVNPCPPSIIRKMVFRKRLEPILACDPLSSISLAFLFFTEKINTNERNGETWSGQERTY